MMALSTNAELQEIEVKDRVSTLITGLGIFQIARKLLILDLCGNWILLATGGGRIFMKGVQA